jgi:hypothetical protein
MRLVDGGAIESQIASYVIKKKGSGLHTWVGGLEFVNDLRYIRLSLVVVV